ncbi:MAG: isocitrate/isopropylmalate dehydrogenase family protein [Tepidisphaerales bacterium]
MAHQAVIIRGDGTGPEICDAVFRIINASGVNIEWIDAIAGEQALKAGKPIVPDETVELIRKVKVALKGPMGTPVGKGSVSANVTLRKKLDLYACVRPIRQLPGVKVPFEGLDLVIFRENTEDLYAQIEYYVTPTMTLAKKFITVRGTQRIARAAFEYARKHKRKKVTCVHKANIMKVTDGLFLKVCREVAQEYPEIEFNDNIVDNQCMQLVTKWKLYDVIVTENLYGDILSDLCAGMMGGLGLAPGANYGQDCAVFEAVHGSAPKYAGLNKVNPTAVLLSGLMMLDHLGETEASKRIMTALETVLVEGKVRTYDLGGTSGTREFADEIIRKMK